MSSDVMTPSGIPAVGLLPWGSHFCHLYASEHDLAQTLVPYFQAGLDRGERCLWVTCEPLGRDAARDALRNAVPDLDQRCERGDIQIFGHEEWYELHAHASARDVLRAWNAQAGDALARGYAGLRITGNTFFLDAGGWDDFAAYEALVNAAFKEQPVLALCSYSLGKCSCESILDVVRNHDFALARRRGEWEMIENATLKLAKAELVRLNAELDRRVEERTAELNRALHERDVLLREVNHRVKNNLQVITSMLNLQSRQASDPAVVDQLRDARTRISSIGLVHALLQQGQGATPLDAESLVSQLVTALLELFDPGRERIGVDVAVPRTPLSADQGMLLGMLLAELLGNALKHAFADGRPGTIGIQWEAAAAPDGSLAAGRKGGLPAPDWVRLTVKDDGVGFDPGAVRPGGLGRMIVVQLARRLSAEMTTMSRPGAGTTVELLFPLGAGHRQEPVLAA